MGAGGEVAGQRLERIGGEAEGFDGGEGLGDEPAGVAARLLEAVDGGPGGLDAGRVLAGGLAKLLGRLRHVEDVVDDLEGEADLFAECAQSRDGRDPHLGIEMWGTRICGQTVESAADDAGGDERAGLGAVDGLDQFGGGRDAFGLDVYHLATDHSGGKSGVNLAGATDSGADCDGDLAHDPHHGIGWRGELGDGLEGERLERVAGQDRDGLAEGDVACGLAAAQVVVVQRGQIVVDQRVGVQHLQRGAERVDACGQLAGSRDHSRGLHAKNGAQPLSAGEDAVAHGAMDGDRQRLGRWQKAFERGVGEFCAGGEQGLNVGIHRLR